MKHLKVYENNKKELWIISKISTMGPDDFTLDIFEDKESAENCLIVMVNDAAIEDNYDDGKGDIDYIFTVDDAKNHSSSQYSFELYQYNIQGKYELPEELKLGRDTNKYNL